MIIKDMVKRKVDITPDKSLMEKMGYVGFKPDEAFAEFVDNSLDAKYNPKTGEVIIPGTIRVDITLEAERIRIKDESAGIYDFDNCLKLAFSEKVWKEALGEFGLGLKTATMSLGRKVIIRSTRIGEPLLHTTTVDMDEWNNTPGWELEIEDQPAPLEEHWTEIIIEKLFISPAYCDETGRLTAAKGEDLRTKLSDRFGEFIRNKELCIFINKREIITTPTAFLNPKTDPQYQEAIRDLKLKHFKLRKNFSFFINGMEIHGWIDILKERSLTGNYGFNIYRERRLIDPFSKIGIRKHPTHANIFGHIHLPRDFPISFTKNQIETQRYIYRKLKEKMKNEAKDHAHIATRMSQKTAPTVKRKTVSDLTQKLDALESAIPKSEVIKSLLPEWPEERRRALPTEATGHGEVDAEKRKTKTKRTIIRPKPKNARVRNPRKYRQRKNYWYVKLPSGKIKLSYEFIEANGKKPSMYAAEYFEDISPPEYRVSINTCFNAWGTTKDESFYSTGVIIAALSDLVCKLAEEKNPLPLEIYEDLWRVWGKEFCIRIAKR